MKIKCPCCGKEFDWIPEWIPANNLPPEGMLCLVRGVGENPYHMGLDLAWISTGRWTSWHLKQIKSYLPLPPFIPVDDDFIQSAKSLSAIENMLKEDKNHANQK